MDVVERAKFFPVHDFQWRGGVRDWVKAMVWHHVVSAPSGVLVAMPEARCLCTRFATIRLNSRWRAPSVVRRNAPPPLLPTILILTWGEAGERAL